MAICLENLNRYDEAAECFKICYKTRVQTLGPNEEETLNSLYRVAVCLLKGGNKMEAIENFIECYTKTKNKPLWFTPNAEDFLYSIGYLS